MDKITSSDKFKQLRLNIAGSVRSNNLRCSNNSENQRKKIGVKGTEEYERISGSKAARVSPRRSQETKKCDFNKLQCTFKNKTSSDKIFPPNNNELTINRGRRQVTTSHRENNCYNFDEKNILMEKNERDSSGFLKPLEPAPRRNVHNPFVNEHLHSTKDQSAFLKPVNPGSERSSHEPFVMEQLQIFKDLMQRIIDTSLFQEVETEYHIHVLFNKTLSKIKRKVYLNKAIPQNVASNDRIQSWLHSSQDTSKLPESRIDNLDKSSKILSVLTESTLNSEVDKKNPAYLLKDWTVIKGSGETELMVSGVLIDTRSRKVLEQNHRSSSIVERTGDNFVKTVCCLYQLCGDFVEEGKGVPPEIRKYFGNGKFPDQWRTLASKWHLLNNASCKSMASTSSARNISKRILEDLSNNGSDGWVHAKKLKINYKKN